MDHQRLVASILERPPRPPRHRPTDIRAVLRGALLSRAGRSRAHRRAATWTSIVAKMKGRPAAR